MYPSLLQTYIILRRRTQARSSPIKLPQNHEYSNIPHTILSWTPDEALHRGMSLGQCVRFRKCDDTQHFIKHPSAALQAVRR
mmetsp:Transcript_13046/g.27716  ORF Transcript_13046/g.27716 Transcript_13046/m.27716 type:complete len:82 (+) Transcript_13046:1552-1797(+)